GIQSRLYEGHADGGPLIGRDPAIGGDPNGGRLREGVCLRPQRAGRGARGRARSIPVCSPARGVDFALKNRLPSIYAWKDPVSARGLIAYGVNIPHVYRRAAYYAD